LPPLALPSCKARQAQPPLGGWSNSCEARFAVREQAWAKAGAMGWRDSDTRFGKSTAVGIAHEVASAEAKARPAKQGER